jgi:hypothetical protein
MRYLDEQFPLAPIDDHMIHQTPDPIRVVSSSDPRFYERYWNVVHDEIGELVLAFGGSFYPNLNSAEAYAIVNLRGQHRSVRAFRRLSADRMNLRVGPITPTIVEGLRRWRHVLEPNHWGISYDLEFVDRTRQIYDIASAAPISGSQAVMTAGFEGFGDVTGWVQVGEERVEWGPGQASGTRDRHWGIGRGVGGPALSSGRPAKAGWKGGNWIRFDDFAVWGRRLLFEFGNPTPGAGRVVHTDRRLRFEKDTKIFVEGILDYTFDDGRKRQVHFERLGYQTAYMRCGMYGGTAEDGIHHGQLTGADLSADRIEGDCYDVTDPAVRIHLRGLDEHHCRITCGQQTATGILQPLEPDAYEACLQGRPGWQFL